MIARVLAFFSSFCVIALNGWAGVADFVDPFVGTAGNGHTNPGAARPFSLVKPGPDTGNGSWEYCGGYRYEDKAVAGFSQTHLSGVGRAEMGDILLMPFSGPHDPPDAVTFSHERESAVPGYYAVSLEDDKIRAEMTSTARVALHRYTYREFPARLLVDLQHGLTSVSNLVDSHVLDCQWSFEKDGRTLSGRSRVRKNWPEHSYSFVITFDRPIVRWSKLPAKGRERGPRFVLDFDLKSGDSLQVKVALSLQSVEGAKKNMRVELPGWDFDCIRGESLAEWEGLLLRVRIKTEDVSLKRTFYTALYHAFLHPDVVSDVDEVIRYSTFSLWDTFRAAHPLYTLLVPERVPAFVSSLIAHWREHGRLPVWMMWGREGDCMIGNHAVPVLLDAWRKGLGVDAEQAYAAIRDTLLVDHADNPKDDWAVYDRYGYYPLDLIPREGVSRTFECSYDDWCALAFARELAKTEDADRFERRAASWRNVFDSELGFARGRRSDGTWRMPFRPCWYGVPRHCTRNARIEQDFTEGNAWQYSFHVLHDVPGLICAFGGQERLLARLDELYVNQDRDGPKCRDASGQIGQYSHGNEPCHHIPYLYALLGDRKKTVATVDRICREFYRDKPNGLCGNDDCGQMSAWYVFATLGFYPYDPASAEYVLSVPRVSEYELTLAGGHVLSCHTPIGTGPSDAMPGAPSLNGNPIVGSVVSHAELIKGGVLSFASGNRLKYENPVWHFDSPDPTVWQGQSNVYYSSSTAQDVLVSTNLVHWKKTGHRLLGSAEYEWISQTWPHVWAPDVVKIGDWYNLYISFHRGGEHTAIACYRSKDPAGPFSDRKIVIRSEGNGRHEVIDPEVVVDNCSDDVWLYFGHGDVRRIRLTRDGREQAPDAKVEHVAGVVLGQGPRAADAHEGIYSCEGAYLYWRAGFWYLFCSIGGWQTPNYRVLVGRSPTLDGEFLDKSGRTLADGYGTVILRSDRDDDFFGPGHNGEIFTTDGGRTFMFYHCHWKNSPKQAVGGNVWTHSADYTPRPLFLQEVFWDNDGWPYFANGGKPQKNCEL